MAAKKILIIEDERNIAELIAFNLRKNGYEYRCTDSGENALKILEREAFDLILLDLMLTGMDGLDFCRLYRTSPTLKQSPIIMLTARGEEADIVSGLEYGADDYMTKPFNILEVKARIKTILRRAGAGKEAPRMEITAGDITININTRSVISHGEPVNLTVKEFDLLNLFMSNIGKIYSRDELLETIWGFDYIGDFRTVDVHIRRLREKIEKDPANPKHIMTKWGVGYYFAE